MKPEDRKRLKQHIEMVVDHKIPEEERMIDFWRMKFEEAREELLKLRLELHTLRFKESQEQRFIWWVREVFAKNVQDTVAGIIEACTYQDEPTAAAGKYGLPIKCFEMMRRLTESTHGIYDGTYLDVEISTVVKNETPENKQVYNENANSLLRSAWMIANRNGEQTNWEAFKNAVYKELVVEHNAKTSSDNNKPSISDVSMTQDILTDIKTGQSVENTNHDYKHDLARRDEQTTKHLEWMAEQGNIITGLRNDLKDRDEIIARLKEDADFWYNGRPFDYTDDYRHRQLMKELE